MTLSESIKTSFEDKKKLWISFIVLVIILLIFTIIFIVHTNQSISKIKTGAIECGHPNICSEIGHIVDNNYCHKTIGLKKILKPLSPNGIQDFWKGKGNTYRGNMQCTSELAPVPLPSVEYPYTQFCMVDGSEPNFRGGQWGYIPNNSACVRR